MGNYEVIKGFISDPNFNLEHEARLALNEAVDFDRPEIVIILLEYVRTNEFIAVLKRAARRERTQTLKALFLHRDFQNISRTDLEKILHEVTTPEILTAFIKECPRLRETAGPLLLHYANQKRFSMVLALLKCQVKIDEEDIVQACHENHDAECIKALLNQLSEPRIISLIAANKGNQDFLTLALKTLVELDSLENVEELLNREPFSENDLMEAYGITKNKQIKHSLIRHFSKEGANERLVQAVQANDFELVEIFLRVGGISSDSIFKGLLYGLSSCPPKILSLFIHCSEFHQVPTDAIEKLIANAIQNYANPEQIALLQTAIDSRDSRSP